MKKFYNNHKRDIPLYASSLVFLVMIILWLFPNRFGLLSEKYLIVQFRSDLKDLANIFYIVITLWLVLVTRKMAEISINSQKAFNRPEILVELFISDEKPITEHFTAIKNVEIRNTSDSEYSDGQLGANIFLVIKNRYGGGKAIVIKINANFEANNPERISLPRTLEIDYLAEGDCVAVYLYRFERPSFDHCSLKLKSCTLQFTTPFNEASGDNPIELKYGIDNQMLATGNHIGAIKLESGIRINN
jgi:hypothetical protein